MNYTEPVYVCGNTTIYLFVCLSNWLLAYICIYLFIKYILSNLMTLTMEEQTTPVKVMIIRLACFYLTVSIDLAYFILFHFVLICSFFHSGDGSHDVERSRHYALFPAAIYSAIPRLIQLLDAAVVGDNTNTTSEAVQQCLSVCLFENTCCLVAEAVQCVIWKCLVEEPALFFRPFQERAVKSGQQVRFKCDRHIYQLITQSLLTLRLP